MVDWRIMLAQISPGLGTLAQNLELHLQIVDKAIAAGASLVIFPELSLTGYLLKDMVPDVAMRVDDERLKPLLHKSREIDILFGAVLEDRDYSFFNAAFYLRGGELAQVHRKVYLPTYGMFEEQRYFACGNSNTLIETPLGPFAIMVCEDFWHLSLSYAAVMRGAMGVLVLAASPGRRMGPDGFASSRDWRLVLASTSLFLQCYTVFANRVGFEDGINFWGGSTVYSPDGEGAEPLGRAAGEQLYELSTTELRASRIVLPIIRDERRSILRAELAKMEQEDGR